MNEQNTCTFPKQRYDIKTISFLRHFMMGTIHINQWGSALGLRLPKAICQQLNIQKDTLLSIREENNRIILEPIPSGKTLQSMLDRITPENIHGEISTGGSALGNESW